MNYYQLPRDKWWLHFPTMDSPFEIGGRATDLSEIAHSLYLRVHDLFGRDEVPAEIDVKLRRLTETLDQAEKDIQEFISVVSRHVAGGG